MQCNAMQPSGEKRDSENKNSSNNNNNKNSNDNNNGRKPKPKTTHQKNYTTDKNETKWHGSQDRHSKQIQRNEPPSERTNEAQPILWIANLSNELTNNERINP
mmetsp:Transcript_29907/g.70481  ORF Transcript_29907/g.70481 Transcript_29907/m.70481 type:complete len:103 (+) Transcript_29907:1-309(+)